MITMLPADVTQPDLWDRLDSAFEVVTWQGHPSVRFEGLALLRGVRSPCAEIEARVWAEGPCYPGFAFHVVDPGSFELAYPVPHVTDQWDALQYDPVFNRSNTWQAFHGPAYQRAVTVPMQRWFTLRLRFDETRASIAVDDQSPLVVSQLARRETSGGLGLWCYRPAYFSQLRLSIGDVRLPAMGETAQHAPDGAIPDGAIMEWDVPSIGAVRCEPNGILLVNRWLPVSAGRVHVARRFEVAEAGSFEIRFGFSDALSLFLDGERLFEGQTLWTGFADRAARGYIEPDAHAIRCDLHAGIHHLEADLGVSEYFGWGLTLALRGTGLTLLPTGAD